MILFALVTGISAALAPGSGQTPTTAQALSVGGYFPTLPANSPLPSDAQCAALVRKSGWEPRPENTSANHTSTSSYKLPPSSDSETVYTNRVTGAFTGTTDEIIQWGACKWGIDENVVRAQAVQESDWIQSTPGDCRGSSVPAAHGCQSWGLLQIKGTNSPPDYPGTFPYSRDSTAFAVDYALAVRRACFDGKIDWIRDGRYGAGQLWNCVGFWYSGSWSNYGSYLAEVKGHYATQDWNHYGGGTAPTPAPPPSPYNLDSGSGLSVAAAAAAVAPPSARTPAPARPPAASTPAPPPPPPPPTATPEPPAATPDATIDRPIAAVRTPGPIIAPGGPTRHYSSWRLAAEFLWQHLLHLPPLPSRMER